MTDIENIPEMPKISVKVQKTKYKKQKLIKLGNIAGKTKKFDQDLFDKYDGDARNIIKDKLTDLVCDNHDKFGEDLIFKCGDLPYKFIEVQVCSTWEDKLFPYRFPYVFARKMRFSDDTLFITFNKTFTEALMFSKKVISTVPVRLKKYDREMIHYVPWSRVLRIDVDQLNLNNIKIYAGVLINEDD